MSTSKAEPCVHSGHSVLDTTRNITWHMGNDLVFTLAPTSAADVDRTRLPYASHALLLGPIYQSGSIKMQIACAGGNSIIIHRVLLPECSHQTAV